MFKAEEEKICGEIVFVWVYIDSLLRAGAGKEKETLDLLVRRIKVE